MTNRPSKLTVEELWDEQVEAVKVLPECSSYILGDQTGLGKTITGIACYDVIQQKHEDTHLLVVGTKSSTSVWKTRLKEFSDFTFRDFLTGDKELDVMVTPDTDVTLMTFQSMYHFPNLLRAIFTSRKVCLIVDECHKIKSKEDFTYETENYVDLEMRRGDRSRMDGLLRRAGFDFLPSDSFYRAKGAACPTCKEVFEKQVDGQRIWASRGSEFYHESCLLSHEALKGQNIKAKKKKKKRKVLDPKTRKPVRKAFSRAGFVRYLIEHATWSWGLTGTPLLNKIQDLFHLFNSFFPGLLGKNEWEFLETYTVREEKPIYGKFDKRGQPLVIKQIVGYKNLDRLKAIISPHWMKRSRHYDLRYNAVQVNPTQEEMNLYYMAAWGMMGLTLKDFVARLHDLQYAVNNTITGVQKKDDEFGQESGEFDPRVFNDDYSRMSNKEMRAFGLAQEVIDRGEAVILFSTYRWTQKRLINLCKQHLRFNEIYTISGDSTEADRDHVSRNLAPGDVAVISPAGGESLNLQVSNNLIFFDTPFDIGVIIQVIGRIARGDSKHSVFNLYFMEVTGTIDTYKRFYMMHNTDLINKVVDGNGNLPKDAPEISKDYIANLRKDLLWKTQQWKTNQ